MTTLTGTIGGTSLAGRVREMHRRGQLCAPGQSVVFNLRSDFPATINTADEVSIQENGTQTFTGYVTKVTRERPSYDWMVECQDTYTRVTSFFIEDNTVTGYDANNNPIPGYVAQSTDYWIGYLLGLCGMSYHIRDLGRTVPAGVQMGLRTVHESLTDILAFSSQYAFPDEHGVLQIGRAVKNSPAFTFSEFIQYDRKEDDEFTRTEAKVFGYAGLTSRVFASAGVSIPNITPNRITAMSSPMIETTDEAQRVADYLIDELGSVTVIATGTINGNPLVKIGQCARLTHEGYDDTDVVTSLEVDWTEEGYTTKVTIGERCPRISGWSKNSPPVYAGTTTYGIYRSVDNGATWSEFNQGLPSGDKYVKRIAFNSYDEGMAIVNGRLWYIADGSSGSWAEKSVPIESSSGSIPFLLSLIAVDANGTHGQFDVLRSGLISSGSAIITDQNNDLEISDGEYRTWCQSYNSSGSPQWSATLITDSTAIAEPPNILGFDLVSFGVPYVIAKKMNKAWCSRSWGMFKNDFVAVGTAWHGFDIGWSSDASTTGVQDWTLESVDFDPVFQELTFTIRVYVVGGAPSDNVFLYGENVDSGPSLVGYDECGQDGEGYNKWDYQANATCVVYPPVNSYTEWIINDFKVRLGDVGSGQHGDLKFNFFHSTPYALPPTPSDLIGADQPIGRWTVAQGSQLVPSPKLRYFLIGTSPYGDTHHTPGMGLYYRPYPIRTTLGAGTIVYGAWSSGV